MNFDMNEEIWAGIEFKIRYLGSGVLSKSGGTDDEIARVIYDIHDLYGHGKAALKKACEVVVYIDTQKICVNSKSDDEILLSFPLTQVRDVVACLDRPPYSKTCVLVAKKNNEPLYKAYVFYCKTAKKAAQFYRVASMAFQLGFDLLKKYSSSYFTESSLEDPDVLWNGSMEIISKDTNECQIKQIKGRSCQRDGSQHEINKEGLPKNTIENLEPSNNNQEMMGRTATVQPHSEKTPAIQKYAKDHMKIDLYLHEQDEDNFNQSKLRVYVENIEDRSRFLFSRWFRSSYRKFRRISNYQSTAQSTEKVQL